MPIFESRLYRKSSVFRKAISISLSLLTSLDKTLFVKSGHYQAHPPVVVNSLPKSGTHLLLQVTRELPTTRYFGRFIASSPSLTQKERSPKSISSSIRSVLPGETLGAHIYHSNDAVDALTEINALNLFIYRDPRDVLISEVHYLTTMNKWHRMHKHFAALKTVRERVFLAIYGFDDRYPHCAERFRPYVAWLDEPNTFQIRFEDLVGKDPSSKLSDLVQAYTAKGGDCGDLESLVDHLKSCMIPNQSHTFRSGRSGTWSQGLDQDLIDLINFELRDPLAAFGYE